MDAQCEAESTGVSNSLQLEICGHRSYQVAMVNPSHGLIPTLVFDTDDLPPDQRLAAWASHNRSARFEQVEPGVFNVHARLWLVDEMVVSEHRVDAFNAQRDQRLAERWWTDHIMLIIPFSGTTRVMAGDVDVLCSEGDVALLDYGQALATRNSRQHGAAIAIRRDLLEGIQGSIARPGRLPRSAETSILITFVRQLISQLPGLSARNAPKICQIVRDLIVLAIRSGEQEVSSGANGSAALRRQIQDYVAALTPGEVSLPLVMGRFGLTQSRLYRMFRADGGLLAYDRDRRLRMVHRALCASDPRPLADIGFAWGFHDSAYLARLFRQRYGYTMSDIRRQLTARPPQNEDTQSVAAIYRDAVAALSRG